MHHYRAREFWRLANLLAAVFLLDKSRDWAQPPNVDTQDKQVPDKLLPWSNNLLDDCRVK